MECLKITLREAVDNVYLVDEDTVRIKILKSKGTSCFIGLQKKLDSDVEIKLVGVGQFTNGSQIFPLTNAYTFVYVDMDSVIDDESTEVHIKGLSNLNIFNINTPTMSIVDVNDLKYLNQQLTTLGISTEGYAEVEDVINSYENLTYIALYGEGTNLDVNKLSPTSVSKLATIITWCNGVRGDINKLVPSTNTSISILQTYYSSLYGDLALLPSGINKVEGSNQGQYSGNYTWTHRDSSLKQFSIWRISLGNSLDSMLVDMAACQPNSTMVGGFRVYGIHTKEDSIWRAAAQNLANSTQQQVYVNDELFSPQ